MVAERRAMAETTGQLMLREATVWRQARIDRLEHVRAEFYKQIEHILLVFVIILQSTCL